MDLKLLVLLLSWVFSVESFLPNCAKSSNCVCSSNYSSHVLYHCPTWNEPDFQFNLTYYPYQSTTITCMGKLGLEQFSGKFYDELEHSTVLKIKNCNVSGNVSLAKVVSRIGVKNITEMTLYKINFENNLTPKNFEGLDELKNLDISGLNLRKLNEHLLDGAPNLETLTLNNNPINEIPELFFNNLLNLTTLALSGNMLTAIPSKALQKTKKLTQINLTKNNLTEIKSDSFKHLTSLRTITLMETYLKEISSKSFYGLSKLVKLHMSFLNVYTLPENLFETNRNLSLIHIYYNKLNITKLPGRLLSNLSSLEEVMLIQIGLQSIPKDTFSHSTGLKKINLSYNHLINLPEELCDGLTNLVSLVVGDNQLETVSNRLFRDLKNLEFLCLEGNRIRTIKNDQFIGLSSLESLSMARNTIEVIEHESMTPLKNLRIASFQQNKINFNETYPLNGNSASPFSSCLKLEVLNLNENNISIIFNDWIHASKLKYLNLPANNITKIDEDTVNRKSNNATINISNNPIICDCTLYNFKKFMDNRTNRKHFLINLLICKGPKNMAGLDVKYVDLKDLVCKITNTNTSKVCPDSCLCEFSPYENADLVDCSNQNLTEAPPELFSSKEERSIHLNLTGNRLRNLPLKYQPNYNLVTKLYASHNQIELVDDINIIPTLKVLALDHNNIQIFETSTIYAITNSSIEELTLANNLWTCNCAAREFISFVKNYYRKKDVVCFENNRPFFEITEAEICFNDNTIIYTSVSVALMATMIAVVAILYYRYQIEIKIWLYAHQYCMALITEDDLDKDKPYDAFISYSHKDEEFVMNELVKKLESGPQPYKLCLHFRDWLAGDLIPSQIARSVEDSKRTIIVLSENFLSSVWGAMEFRAAHRQALVEGRARVIVVVYGDVPAENDLDTELKTYLKMNTYVQWGDKWFWNKLRYAMPHGPKIKGLKKSLTSNNSDPPSRTYLDCQK